MRVWRALNDWFYKCESYTDEPLDNFSFQKRFKEAGGRPRISLCRNISALTHFYGITLFNKHFHRASYSIMATAARFHHDCSVEQT